MARCRWPETAPLLPSDKRIFAARGVPLQFRGWQRERRGRKILKLDDRVSEAAMEDRKRVGYF